MGALKAKSEIVAPKVSKTTIPTFAGGSKDTTPILDHFENQLL